MIDTLLKVADLLLGRSDKLREAEADRRRRASLYFENVSRCLSEIAKSLRAEEWPLGCYELDGYNQQDNPEDWHKGGQPVIAQIFGEELAQSVRRELSELSNVRGGALGALVRIQGRKRVPRRSDPYTPESKRLYDESIEKIERAAGRFKALSVLALTTDP